jgi:hypothetical protein
VKINNVEIDLDKIDMNRLAKEEEKDSKKI